MAHWRAYVNYDNMRLVLLLDTPLVYTCYTRLSSHVLSFDVHCLVLVPSIFTARPP